MDIPKTLTPDLIQRLMGLSPSGKTDYLKSELLSKFVSSETDAPSVRRQRAINKWLATERTNEGTNDRLLILPEDYNILPRVSWRSFVGFARQLVSRLIGDTAPIEALIGGFSGGASTSRDRTCSHPGGKYLGQAHVTEAALPWFELLKDELPGWPAWDLYDFKIVEGNVMFTVPKKTDIDRVACKEPDLNMFLQKGIGDWFRRSLRRERINLNDQSINRSLAREGSVTGRLATLDLSSASDSISRVLVQTFLPECWFSLLDDIRCKSTIIDGHVHQNEMFSSMGNGFTFELESLLFYVFARTTAYFRGVSGVISIYGDDIICPTEMAHDLSFVLSVLGFEVNLSKSFIDGPFRESCGGHYLNGLDVTPFYIRKPIETLTELLNVANSLRRWAQVEGLSVLDPEVEAIWLWLKSFVPDVLWGGHDTSDPHSLVSYPPRAGRKLVAKTVKKQVGEGSYYHWLNATWQRQDVKDGIETSILSSVIPKYRYGKRRLTVTSLPAIFLSEIADAERVEVHSQSS